MGAVSLTSPLVTRAVVSPRVGSPAVRSPTVRRVSPIAPTPSPGIGSPLIRRLTSPTATVPKSPTVASPGIARVGSPKMPWEEWFVSYRSEPTPHKGFEGVYLGLPDVARPGPVTIKGLQRMTVGPAPARRVRPKVARGKVVRVSQPKQSRENYTSAPVVRTVAQPTFGKCIYHIYICII